MPRLLVTGARQGLGPELVRRFAELDEWRIIATRLDRDGATGLQAIADRADGRAVIYRPDVDDHSMIDELAKALDGAGPERSGNFSPYDGSIHPR